MVVAPGQRATAVSALEEANLGPRSPIDLIDQPAEQGVFDTIPRVKERQERLRLRGLEELVRNVDPAAIDRAHIEVFRPQARAFGKAAEPKATVFLFTEAGRTVSPRALAAIQRLLVGMEPDLKPESVTVIGNRGTPYLIQGDPALMVESQAQARAEELAAQVQDKLRWIEGVKVSVRIDPAPAANPAPTPTPAPEPTAPIVAPNAPMSLPADELPTATVTAPLPAEAIEVPGRVIVLVQVPIAYYLHRARAGEPGRESSPGDLRAYAEKVENSIRFAVRHVAPGRRRKTSRSAGSTRSARRCPSIGAPQGRSGLGPGGGRRPAGGGGPAAELAGESEAGCEALATRQAKAVRPVPGRRGDGGRGPVGARARAGPHGPRGRRGRPPALDRPGGGLRMTVAESRATAPPDRPGQPAHGRVEPPAQGGDPGRQPGAAAGLAAPGADGPGGRSRR